ncbi:hypothetical protein BASA60_007715 [Batrachochytrium salamandrivorans]|nr:hypothetical protein BASA60_007715 [Batrachochytrium salamandrivorans]KAH9256175.1 hypothetical protein BASA81_005669 [Batrachochytrium salamandrivorans]
MHSSRMAAKAAAAATAAAATAAAAAAATAVVANTNTNNSSNNNSSNNNSNNNSSNNINGSRETSNSTPAKSGRGPNFAREEDRLLVSCYMTASEDSAKSPGQSKEALAHRVSMSWQERYVLELPLAQHETAQARSSKSLTNRFADLKRDIKFYGGCVALYNEAQGSASSGPLCSDAASYIVDRYINTTPVKRIDVVHIAGLWDEFKHYKMFDSPSLLPLQSLQSMQLMQHPQQSMHHHHQQHLAQQSSAKRKFDEDISDIMDDVLDDGMDPIHISNGTESPDASMMPMISAATLAHHDRRMALLAASASANASTNGTINGHSGSKRVRHNLDDEVLTMIADSLAKRNEIAAKRLELQQTSQAEKLMFQKLKQWNSIVRQGQRHLIKLMTKRDASSDRGSYDPLIQSATQVLESSIATLQRIQMAGPVQVDDTSLSNM